MEYKALFLDEDLNEIGNKTFQSTDEILTFKKGTFNIRLNAYLYKNKNTTFYGYIYPTDEKLLIDVRIEPIKENKVIENIKNNEEKKENKQDKKDKNNKNIILYSARLIKIREKIEHGDLKLIMGESIIGQLARLAVLGLKTNWVLLLIIAVAVGVGAGGGGYSLGLNNGINQGFNQAQHIINSTVPYSTPVYVTIPTPYP